MPMERDRYPQNWNLIALTVKTASRWQCQQCGKPCRLPGEAIARFEQRLNARWRSELIQELTNEQNRVQYRPQRFVLTVAHLDQDPGNNHLDNLKALCAPCHLRYDRRFMGQNRMEKLERRGQLNLFVGVKGGKAP
ncbi:MAG: HNH endonuclease signature motif containing protein [Thermosynechococcaceae cyanobacterium]